MTFVDKLLNTGHDQHFSQKLWHDFLNTIRRPDFLSCIASAESRLQWADHMFRIVDLSRYTLCNMLEQRVAEHPQRHLFREADNGHASGVTSRFSPT